MPTYRRFQLILIWVVVALIPGSLVGQSTITTLAQANPTQTQAGTPLPPAGPVIVSLKSDVFSAASDVAAASDIEPTQVYTSVINGFAANVSSSQIRDLASNPLVANIVADTPVEQFAQFIPTSVKRTGIAKYPQAAIDGIPQETNADIAFLDSGIDSSHPDLNVVGGMSCISGGNPYFDGTKHGTHTAGIAAAKDNDFGVVGAAPGARIWSVKVFNDQGKSEQSSVLCGLDWIVSSGVGIDIVNLSIGNDTGSTSVSTCSDQVDPLHDAICSINANGIAVIAAAGNKATDANTYNYSKFPETISVAAISDYNGWPGGGAADRCGYGTGPDDTLANYSNFGSVVDIAAPGSCVLSTVPGGYENAEGTSMAAPLVAGAAALFIARNPGATPSQVRDWLLSDAASKPRSSTVGYTGASTGTDRILYLGPIPSGSNPSGTQNPTFAGKKLTITSSVDAPATGTSANAHDGNPGTKWSSPSTNPLSAQLRLDLGSVSKITGIKWKFDVTGYADEFTIRLLNTESDSRVFGPFGNATQANAFFGQVMSGNTEFRYVDFYFENPRNQSSIGSLSEVEIWGFTLVSHPPGTRNPAFEGTSQPITNSSDTPNTGTSRSAHDGQTWSNWASPATTPTSAKIKFDLGSDRNLSGIKWKVGYLDYADQFIVRIYTAAGSWQDLGQFGNPATNQTWHGVAATDQVTARFVEFIFLNPNRDAALGSISEVEIWTKQYINPPGTPNPTFPGSKATITNSFDTPNTGTTSRARDGVSWSNWAISGKPKTATITFDLGSTREISGVQWQVAYLGAADQFTVRVLDGGRNLVSSLGTFGNPGATKTWYGVATTGTISGRFIEFTFANLNYDAALGSLSEVEIWTRQTPPPGGTPDPTLNGAPLTIVGSGDTPVTGTSGEAWDGVSWSNWATAANSPSYAKIMFDLGSDYSLGGVQWKMSYLGYADKFIIRVYSQAGEWQDFGVFTNPGQTNTWYGMPEDAPITARYVEFIFLNPNRDAALGSLSEVEIWGFAPALRTAIVASPQASPAPATPNAEERAIPDSATPLPLPTQTPTSDQPNATPESAESPDTQGSPVPDLPVEPSPTSVPTTVPTPEPTMAVSLGTITGTDGDVINCRRSPIDGQVITTLTEGDQIEVIGTARDGWYSVICDGQSGFVSADFVTLGTNPPDDDPTPDATETSTATADSEEAPASPEVATTTSEPTTEATATEQPEQTPYTIQATGDTEESGIAWLASDDDPSTYWSVYPGISPEQTRIYFDLGSVVPIERLTIELAVEGMLPYFEIWLSEDGETWYNATPNGINGWDLRANEAHTFTLGYDARYIRLVVPNVVESGLSEVGGIRQVEIWPGDINQTQYLSSLGNSTTPTPVPLAPTQIPTEESLDQPTEEIVEEPTLESTGEAVETPPTEAVIQTEEPAELEPTEEERLEEVPTPD